MFMFVSLFSSTLHSLPTTYLTSQWGNLYHDVYMEVSTMSYELRATSSASYKLPVCIYQ